MEYLQISLGKQCLEPSLVSKFSRSPHIDIQNLNGIAMDKGMGLIRMC